MYREPFSIHHATRRAVAYLVVLAPSSRCVRQLISATGRVQRVVSWCHTRDRQTQSRGKTQNMRPNQGGPVRRSAASPQIEYISRRHPAQSGCVARCSPSPAAPCRVHELQQYLKTYLYYLEQKYTKSMISADCQNPFTQHAKSSSCPILVGF